MKAKTGRAHYAPIRKAALKKAEKPAYHEQAEAKTCQRARGSAGKATNVEFKSQQSQGNQSRRSLQRPANHSAGAGKPAAA